MTDEREDAPKLRPYQLEAVEAVEGLLGADGDAKRVLVVDMPNQRQSWVRDAWLKAGGEVLNINSDYGKLAGYDPDFVAFNEADDLALGRMTVSGKLTAYFENRRLLKHTANRIWNYSRPKLSRGWRRHLRRMKAKRK